MTTDYDRMKSARAVAITSGRSQEHLKFVIDLFDRRTSELLTANNRMVDEVRDERRRAEDAEANIEFLMAHNGTERIRELEEELALRRAESEIVCLVQEWADAIHNLEQSRKKDGDNKGGEGIYKANQHYTACHIALKKYFDERRVLTQPVKKTKTRP